MEGGVMSTLNSKENLVADLEAAAAKWVLEKNKYTLESLRDARRAVLKRMHAGYSQEYADRMRTALLRIQSIAGEPHQQGNREVQIQTISCLASDGLLGIERSLVKDGDVLGMRMVED